MPALAPSSFHRGRPSIVTAPSERGVRWEMALSTNCVPKPGVPKVPHLPSLKELGTRLLHPTYRHLGPPLGMAPSRRSQPAAKPSPHPRLRHRVRSGWGAGSHSPRTQAPGPAAGARAAAAAASRAGLRERPGLERAGTGRRPTQPTLPAASWAGAAVAARPSLR